MTWFKIDDSFYDHPKVFDAPDCAVALWTRAGTWSARNRTDGVVPAGMPARFCDDPERAVRELVQRGLWTRTRGGYQFHDWHDYQPTREEAIAAATKMSSGGALGNHRRWHAGKGRTDPRCPFCNPIGSSGGDEPDPAVTNPRPNYRSGAASGSDRSAPVENHASATPNSANQRQHDRGTHRLPDRPADGTPESPPNPPGPARPVLVGGDLYSATNGRAHPREEPPSRCPEHQDDPDPPACRRCKEAREAHQRWQADERRRLAEAPRCPKHRGQLAHNCAPCRAERLGAE